MSIAFIFYLAQVIMFVSAYVWECPTGISLGRTHSSFLFFIMFTILWSKQGCLMFCLLCIELQWILYCPMSMVTLNYQKIVSSTKLFLYFSEADLPLYCGSYYGKVKFQWKKRDIFLAYSFIYRRKDSYLVSLSEENEETQSVRRKNGWTCISTALGNVFLCSVDLWKLHNCICNFYWLCFPVILISIPILIIVIPEVYLNVYRWYMGTPAYLKVWKFFRSGRISSVYIVGWLLLVRHTFSNCKIGRVLVCWCVGVLVY